jgi:hypothetical protein
MSYGLHKLTRRSLYQVQNIINKFKDMNGA